jgi:ParB family chromosome partitioning protein
MGHGRALITAPDPEKLAADVIRRGLSVRDTERLARAAKDGGTAKERAPKAKTSPDADIAALERQLGDMLGLAVRIAHTGEGGMVTLSYSSLDQLDMICQRLSGEKI